MAVFQRFVEKHVKEHSILDSTSFIYSFVKWMFSVYECYSQVKENCQEKLFINMVKFFF